ncbi:MAG: extracellular solute-binding protein [Spirochaetes bacterium]|nr:extracellular solute-binding protein [Spirochaetota bacterium]
MKSKPKKLIMMLVFVLLILLGSCKKEKARTKVSDEFNWKAYEGTEIVVCWPNHVHYNATIDSGVIEEFEELTGIKVEVDLLQYMRMHDKQVLEMSKASGDYDMVSMVVMWKSEYALADLILPLQPMFDQKHLQVPNYDFDDLVPAYVEVTGIAGGDNVYRKGPGSQLYGLPFGAETSIMIYRKDIFEEHNLKVPQTYDEVIEAAKYIKENVPGVAGLTMRGASGHHATHAYLCHASPYGARIFDDNWEPVFDSPESINTLNFMKKMIEYGPPGMTGFTQDEEFAAFLQGNAAMYIDAIVLATPAKDPNKSKVHDKLGFALHPSAKTSGSETGGFGLAIPKNASNPEAAFLFMQYLTMKETERKIVLNGGAPFRMSTLNDPQIQAKYPEFQVLAEQLKYANPDWRPIIPEWGQINAPYLGVAINQVLTGDKSPEKAMADIKKPIRDILVKAGYIK